mgnify:CR=1 FL=1
MQDAIDVAAQEEIAGFTLGKWAKYYCSRSHSKILNVISLEFSKTPLRHLVRSPSVVRQLDWIDAVWPSSRRAAGQYPAVQYYCLMSVAGCYTDFHVDFGGTSVWYHVFKGEKRFLFIPPSTKNIAKYAEWTTSPKQSSTFFADWTPGQCFEVTLKQGHTMIIPTGWIHAVYTPKDSLVFGGNFLHGLGMAKQLEIYEMEVATRVPRKFCFPFYEHIHWYAAAYYTQLARKPQFRQLLSAISDFTSAKLALTEARQQAAAQPSDAPNAAAAAQSVQLATQSATAAKAALQRLLGALGVALAEAKELPSLAALLAKLREQALLRASEVPTGGGGDLDAPPPGTSRVKGQRGAFATELQATAAAADAARLVGCADPESMLLELTQLVVPSATLPQGAVPGASAEEYVTAADPVTASSTTPQLYRTAPAFGWSLAIADVPGAEGVPLDAATPMAVPGLGADVAAASGCADWYLTEYTTPEQSQIEASTYLNGDSSVPTCRARQAELARGSMPHALRCFDVQGCFLCKGSTPFEDDVRPASKQANHAP